MSRKRLKITLWFLALGLVAVAAISLFQLTSIFRTYREGARTYYALAQFVTPPPQPPSSAQARPAERLPEVDFAALRAINRDIVAWLILEGTPINYPVVQGADNVFYLDHKFDGTHSGVGTLFVDSLNTPGFADQNTIIYGHNMRDGNMFATLLDYQCQEFFQAHPEMLLLTPQGNYLLRLLAGYTVDVMAGSWRISFDDGADFESWVSQARRRSDFTSDVEINPTDRLVTLSTCSYAFEDARYVVIGKLAPIP